MKKTTKKTKPKYRSGTRWTEEKHRENGTVSKKFRLDPVAVENLERLAVKSECSPTKALNALLLELVATR